MLSLSLLVACLSVEDPLAGLPDAEDCQRALAMNREWSCATKRRLEFTINPVERRWLEQAIQEGELTREAWYDLLQARVNPYSSCAGDIPRYQWVRIEIGESRWKLRSMPPPVPWQWATIDRR